MRRVPFYFTIVACGHRLNDTIIKSMLVANLLTYVIMPYFLYTGSLTIVINTLFNHPLLMVQSSPEINSTQNICVVCYY